MQEQAPFGIDDCINMVDLVRCVLDGELEFDEDVSDDARDLLCMVSDWSYRTARQSTELSTLSQILVKDPKKRPRWEMSTKPSNILCPGFLSHVSALKFIHNIVLSFPRIRAVLVTLYSGELRRSHTSP